uniref:Uncharacterized protein n=1 Tax=Tetranychus urticae TaxID=32264 RepID=T1KJV0_TETUR
MGQKVYYALIYSDSQTIGKLFKNAIVNS